MTDTANTYVKVGKEFAHHETVDHRKSEYGRGIFNTNSIEGAFSHFDRMVIGIYHSISPKHYKNMPMNVLSVTISVRPLIAKNSLVL
jgi:hypothetical protein